MLKLPLFSENAVFETRTETLKLTKRLRDFAFMASLNASSIAKVQTSSTCRQTCPFPKLLQTFERRKPNKQLAGNYRNTDCCLAKVEKIRIDVSNELQG